MLNLMCLVNMYYVYTTKQVKQYNFSIVLLKYLPICRQVSKRILKYQPRYYIQNMEMRICQQCTLNFIQPFFNHTIRHTTILKIIVMVNRNQTSKLNSTSLWSIPPQNESTPLQSHLHYVLSFLL